jgi:hypothetical protein
MLLAMSTHSLMLAQVRLAYSLMLMNSGLCCATADGTAGDGDGVCSRGPHPHLVHMT